MRLVTVLVAAWITAACSSAGPGAATPAPATVNPPQTATADATPPAGMLSAPGVEVVGFLGTYCWNGMCADVFDTPPKADLPLVEATSGDLTFSLAGGAAFLSWSASYRSDDQNELTPLGEGGSDYDPDTGASLPPALSEAGFETPPAGEWVLIVQAFFENGDAQYIWHVVVP